MGIRSTQILPSPTRRKLVLGGLLVLASRKSAAFNPDDPEILRAPRSIYVVNAHTGERGEFLFWRDGNTVLTEYEALCGLCRDHHDGKAAFISLRTLTLLYVAQEWYRQVAQRPARTILTSAYRTEETDRRVGGAGEFHPDGRALDGHMEGITVETFAKILGHFRSGGVGRYSRHVHWDDGPTRRW